MKKLIQIIHKKSLPCQTGRTVFALLFTLAITFGFVIYSLIPRFPVESVPMGDGVIDMTFVDFQKNIVRLPLSWDYYPGKLYTPFDFAEGNTENPQAFAPKNESLYQTGTYRIVLKLPPEQAYTLSARSLDCATRIFIDGREALNAGNVTETARDFIPRMKRYTLPVVPQTEKVEIIIQYAHFPLYKGGAMEEMHFGLPYNIDSYTSISQGAESMLWGALLLVAVFSFMLFLSRRDFSNLAFALCCFFLAAQNQQFVISLMPPDYNFSFVYRLLYTCELFTITAFLLFVYSLHPSLLPAKTARTTVAGTVYAALGLTVVSLFVPLPVLSRVTALSFLVFLPAVVYIGWVCVRLFVKGRSFDHIAAAGIVFLLVTLILQRCMPDVTEISLFGIPVFVICLMFTTSMKKESSRRAATPLPIDDKGILLTGFRVFDDSEN